MKNKKVVLKWPPILHSKKEYQIWLENAYSSAYYAGYRRGYEDCEKKKQKISEEHHTYPPKK